MDRIVPDYVVGFIYGALVESYSCEQNARMMAMEAATKKMCIRDRNIPLDKITEDRILRRFPDKEKSFYIIGSYSYRSEKAVKAFKKLGYKNAIFGGYMEEHHGILVK